MNYINPLNAIALVAEEKIREAQAAGAFDNLPGRGRPLVPEDDSHLPPEARMAHKILKNSGYLPEAEGLESRRVSEPEPESAAGKAAGVRADNAPGDSKRPACDAADRLSRLKRFALLMARARRARAAGRVRLPLPSAVSPEQPPEDFSLLEATLLDSAQDSPYLEKLLDRLPRR